MALYAPDCVLESPLVRHLLGAELGIVEGREKLREFVRIVFERQPAARSASSTRPKSVAQRNPVKRSMRLAS
jgi:hypothetical protein